MFDHRHYVPILRWKRAEWVALRHLEPGDRARLTPLVEITPRSVTPGTRRPTIGQMLQKNAEDMAENWGRSRLFVDLWHVGHLSDCEGLHPFVYLAQEGRRCRVEFVPVTGLGRLPAYQAAVASIAAEDGRGLCLRLFSTDLARPALRQDLLELLSSLEVNFGQVDLVVDFQYVQCSCPDLATLVASVPHLNDWRSLTLASGAFPMDLRSFSVGEHPLPRLDWQAWLRLMRLGGQPTRRPSYGDYTIQHAIYGEPPERPNFSASIRYAAEDYWVIMRGAGVFTDGSPGFAQWPANALRLCRRREFRGEDFSYGDRYIWEMSQQTGQTGSAETWLRAGINHHLVFVARQIANLFAT